MSNVRELTLGRWPEILMKCGADAVLLDGKHRPCPACGGKDRFRFDNKDGRGTHICSQCGAGDGFNLLQKMFGYTFKEAARMVEESLGIEGSKPPSREQQEAYRRKLDAERSKREEQEAETHRLAAIEAEKIYGQAEPASADHPYPKLKQVSLHRFYKLIRCRDGELVIPVFINGRIVSIQFISPDGRKRFLKGGEITGGGCVLPGNDHARQIIFIVEGLATGLTVREATGQTVIVAFNAGNLKPVAESIRARYPEYEIVIAADNDHRTDGNPGLTKGKDAADAVGGLVVHPTFTDDEQGTDWNDYAAIHGTPAVRDEIKQQIKAQGQRVKEAQKAVYGVSIVQATDVKAEPINWLWDGWLAGGKLIILAGQAGTGKTTLAISMAATISTGGTWPDGSLATTGSVLIWSGEDDPADSLIPRLMASGADLQRVFFVGEVLDCDGVRNFDPANDMARLMEKIPNIPELRLIIIDPVVSAVTGDSHKNAEVRRGLQPIVDMANRVGAAVLGITHFTKGSKGADPTERVTGSLAFGALARLVMCTAKPTDSEDKRRLVRSKSNIGPDGGGFEYELKRVSVADGIEGQAIQWCDAIDGAAHDLLADVESDDGGRASDKTEAERWLLEILEDAPLTKKSVERLAVNAGFSMRTVQRAAKDCANIEVKRVGFGKDKKSIWSSTKLPYAPTRKNGASNEDAGAYDESLAITQKQADDRAKKTPYAPDNMSGAYGQKQGKNSLSDHEQNQAENSAEIDPFGDDEGIIF